MARRRIYHLRDQPFSEIGDWLDSFERLWEARLDSLESFLSTIGSSTRDDHP